MDPTAAPPALLDALAAVFTANGLDPRAWALGLARATPAVTLVPAFGLSAVPVPTRLALGLALGACIAPALAGVASSEGLLVVELAKQAFLGLPVALVAALSIYVATIAGGVVDDLRGGRELVGLPVLPESLPPVSVLFGLVACVALLEGGGAARVAAALASPVLEGRFSWPAVVAAFSASIGLAFAIAAPLVVAAVLLEAASALIARAATPAFIAPVIAPLKSVALLGVLALVFERVAELVAVLAAGAP
ncbi:MAG TPA: flagellar biosynthetic protein FliR [Polyangiaceae bacterium]|nr:flagellar biosynthetic protein FliR [Polyangiaceae bacterium]